VVEALGPGVALELARGGGDPDILVSDLVMPVMSGLDLLDHLRADRPGLPALLMSGRRAVRCRNGLPVA
jgi:two-component system cell cycle sensor histidine kinase/response regulator CckA